MKLADGTISNNFLSYKRYILERRKKYALHAQQINTLQTILENEALNTYFQPILDLQTGESFGFEALNRPISQSVFSTTDELTMSFHLNAYAETWHFNAFMTDYDKTLQSDLPFCF